jgi:hypothetical protein
VSPAVQVFEGDGVDHGFPARRKAETRRYQAMYDKDGKWCGYYAGCYPNGRPFLSFDATQARFAYMQELDGLMVAWYVGYRRTLIEEHELDDFQRVVENSETEKVAMADPELGPMLRQAQQSIQKTLSRMKP